MPKQRVIFNPLEIDDIDGKVVRLGQTMGDDANIIDISHDQLPDLVRALQAIHAEHQHEIDCYRLDFILMWNGTPVLAVECDGHEWHEKTKEQAARDKSRDRYVLCEHGLPTLRFTGSEIYAAAEGCAEQAIAAAHSIVAGLAWSEYLEAQDGG